MASFVDRLRSGFKPPRTLSFTRAGKYFVFMTLGVGFGAINTGNNLLFLLLGMMLSLIIASGVLSEAVLRKLEARRIPPKRLFARQTAPGRFELENPKRYPSLSVEVTEMNPVCEVGPLEGREIGSQRVPWWKFWREGAAYATADGSEVDGNGGDGNGGDGHAAGSEPVASAYCLRIDPDDTADLEARYRFPTRGRYRLPGLSVVTRFPFSFFEKTRDIEGADDIVIYPASRPAEEWSARIYSAFGEVSSNDRGQGEEYFGLREYRPGEDKRMIHWKRSAARGGDLVIRENEQQEQRAVIIHLYNASGKPADQRASAVPGFEAGLEQTVGLIESLRASGYRIGLQTLDGELLLSEAGGDTDAMYRHLATLQLQDGRPPLPEAPDGDNAAGRILVGLPQAIAGRRGNWDLVLEMDEDAPPPGAAI